MVILLIIQMVVGYWIHYKKLHKDNKIVITLWNHTGKIQIMFGYNIDNWHIENKYPQPVQVIGIVRVYKQKNCL